MVRVCSRIFHIRGYSAVLYSLVSKSSFSIYKFLLDRNVLSSNYYCSLCLLFYIPNVISWKLLVPKLSPLTNEHWYFPASQSWTLLMYRLLPDTECLHLNLSVTFGCSYTTRDPKGYEVEEKSQRKLTTSVESQLSFTEEPTWTTLTCDNAWTAVNIISHHNVTMSKPASNYHMTLYFKDTV